MPFMGSRLVTKSCKNIEEDASFPYFCRHIFLELATGGDLFSYMVKNGSLCEGEVKYIAFQLMKGLHVSISIQALLTKLTKCLISISIKNAFLIVVR